MLELYILICIIIVLIAVIEYKKSSEYFEGESNGYYLTSCPSGYTSFHDKNNILQCCSSNDVSGNMCNGPKVCALTGSSNVPNCIDFVAADYKQKGKDVCPPSMPHYYENSVKKIYGCTSGKLNQTMDGIALPKQPTCKIYNTADNGVTQLDSCFNQMEMDHFKCFADNCTKSLIQHTKDTPVQISVSFSDSTGIPRTGITRASMKRFLDATKPNWKDTMNLDTNIAVAEVAKAVYVDKTMQPDQITH